MKKLTLLLVIIICVSCKTKQEESIFQNETNFVAEVYNEANLSSGTLERIENFPTEFIKPRNVDIWLPEGYSKEKKYAVLYMHDGQMLFDATTTWNKQEWKVDEVASQLMKEGKTKDFIVIGIWNIPELRNSNYFPEKAHSTMSQKDKDALNAVGKKRGWINTINSNNYLKFLVKELKPFIDKNYSTLTDVNNTVVLGSSRGGLISMYAISEYPEIFSAAACLSTHWIGTYSDVDNQIPDSFFGYMKNNLPSPKTHKLYFDYGTQTLDKFYPQYAHHVDSIAKEYGFNDSNFKNLKFEGTEHSENAWANRLDIPLTFLLGK